MTQLRITLPATRSVPLRWVAGIVCRDILGIDVRVVEGTGPYVVISAEGSSLVLESAFPDLNRDRLSWADQLPLLPLAQFDINRQFALDLDEPLPVLFGRGEVSYSAAEITCSVDIFGTIFFMLSRFEEVVLSDRDNHDRFPATASLAWRAGFLYRPIVDEYVELLWALMKRLWPRLQRKWRVGSTRITCDVDRPFDPVGTSIPMILRVLGSEWIKHPRPVIGARRAANFLVHRFGSRRFDPFFTFDWYLEACEKAGQRAAFYFIADNSAGAIDGDYQIESPAVLDLFTKIATLGHEIGVHGSYNSFRDPQQLKREKQRLEAACRKAGLDIAVTGSRQHYLRWDAGQTPDYLNDAGFEYDTTGSFADRPGFRYGTAHPFPMWSWIELGPLKIVQRPLVVMEASIMSPQYCGLGASAEALALMTQLKRRALQHGGDFTLLWHNSELMRTADRRLFEAIIAGPVHG